MVAPMRNQYLLLLYIVICTARCIQSNRNHYSLLLISSNLILKQTKHPIALIQIIIIIVECSPRTRAESNSVRDSVRRGRGWDHRTGIGSGSDKWRNQCQAEEKGTRGTQQVRRTYIEQRIEKERVRDIKVIKSQQ